MGILMHAAPQVCGQTSESATNTQIFGLPGNALGLPPAKVGEFITVIAPPTPRTARQYAWLWQLVWYGPPAQCRHLVPSRPAPSVLLPRRATAGRLL